MSMSYGLETPLAAVKGVGPKLAAIFAARQLETVKDLLLFVPLRYEDRSNQAAIAQLQTGELVTLKATVLNTNNYYKGRRSIQSATLKDDTGRLKVMWFNNRFILDKLRIGQTYLFSGKKNDRGIMVQPTVEDDKIDTIHTNRLVPVYSTITGIKQGSLRRILKHVLDNTEPIEEPFASEFLPLQQTLAQLHFPDMGEKVIQARERLALEELLSLMQKSQQIKDRWLKDKTALVLDLTRAEERIPSSIPFELTGAQVTAIDEILKDVAQPHPMNRLMVGDVGSGKTVVAGVAIHHALANGASAALVAPTRILADQHAETLRKLFPEMPIELVAAGTSAAKFQPAAQPTLYVGTHAVINRLEQIKPALIVYDEQHRFGVRQRSYDGFAGQHPHVLTMSATPIPRSLMLTIFSHLELSVIDELPKGRLPVKTWVTPESKRAGAYDWMVKEIQQNQSQALIVCPFIDPSNAEALENVAAVTDMYEKIERALGGRGLRLALLHGRQAKKEQAVITDKLYHREIDVLVTTPIVEVGVDLPAASIIVIEAAERFGLASLHQLRGRVGRAGQQAYCLLFSPSRQEETQQRLQKFAEITNGRELAELDLERRGAGDIFGTAQHGFDQLVFANWANVELISQARKLFEAVSTQPTWQPFFADKFQKNPQAPAAN